RRALRYDPAVAFGRDTRSLDSLILLPERQAVGAHFDDRNALVLFRYLALLTAIYLLALIGLAAEGEYQRMAVIGAALILARLVVMLRDRPTLERRFRPILYSTLVLQPLLARVAAWATDHPYSPLDVFLPLPLLFFRLPSIVLFPILGLLWGLSAGRDLLVAALGDAPIQVAPLLGLTAYTIAILLISQSQTRKRHLDFLIGWRREHQRHRERQRMRDELDDARRIQLSMLPRSDPSSTWLDAAGISIPASEVGGDYYEYFRVSETRQAVVVADVAGHGVASGLLLAGVRSCLYLLQETQLQPREVLEKIDRVVRATTGKRDFVTMIYALFDHDQRKVVVSAAGHPPILHYVAATGQVEEIGLQALPLGTSLPRQIDEVEVSFGEGDLFLAVTDGIAETVDGRGNVYGTERLGDKLRTTHHDRSAREIRDTMLGDVWSFKADGEQTDDITLVVVKMR
ncbi:MAG: SpoIIE family protein phosphatase, partial [Acidobacteriota bacterium]